MWIGEAAERIRHQYALRTAVKEALDTLPAAVCYFNSSGSVKLCNAVMYRLFRKMAQSDLQSYQELKSALDGCDSSTGIVRDGNVFLFPDGSVWKYSEAPVKTEYGEIYIETVFSNVTELYERRQELKRQSKELKKMYEELKNLSDHMKEAAREQEILNMKSRLHDQMNLGVTAIRQMLRSGTASSENSAAVVQFRRAIQVLQEENSCPQEGLTEFIHDAAVSGIHVKITGQMPKERETLELFLKIMREACVNAARHADATKLFVEVERGQGWHMLRVTNDGRPPEEATAPRGGLADLERLVVKEDGRMEICWHPSFVLTVRLPDCVGVRL